MELIMKTKMENQYSKQMTIRKEQEQLKAAVRSDSVFGFEPKVNMKLTKIEKQNLDDLEKYQAMKWLVEATKLHSTQSFGELALINNEPRSAQVKCETNCVFAVLHKEDFVNILQRVE
jgi:CRP-like cAMP-binding protein